MTAVEWLEQKLKGDKIFSLDVIIKKALEMEKQQMNDAFIEGHNVCKFITDNTDEAKECFDDFFKTYKP